MLLYSLFTTIGKIVKEGIHLDKSTLAPKVTHQLVASMTGLTRETATIQVNKLLREGFLVRSNTATIIIPNAEKLIKDIY